MGDASTDDARVEFPPVDDRLVSRRHRRLAVASETGGVELLPGEYDALRWYDTDRGGSVLWPALGLHGTWLPTEE
ncbi:hypothetical protein AB0B01_10610 [Streptomyces sp. NPDC044571]|uniref:hypothetical protein n=1 Tax=Streptomyces sp. NPDC044571 TaxID=3155371 RepID=UPI0033F3F784